MQLEKLDEKRNKRWSNGLAYMDERQKLENSYIGENIDTELDDLRLAYFKHEAETF